MKIEINNIEQMSEQLHVWYLEGTRKLDPANYNPKAQKAYADLNDQQKEIDRYIAKKVISALDAERQCSKELREDLDHYSEVIDKREQQLLSALDALKFYADKENWVNDVLGLPTHSSEVEGSNQINQDGGMIARDALTLNLWKQT